PLWPATVLCSSHNMSRRARGRAGVGVQSGPSKQPTFGKSRGQGKPTLRNKKRARYMPGAFATINQMIGLRLPRRRQPLAILLLVIRLEVTALDRPPPPLVGLIPGHGLGHARLKVFGGLPTQRLQLGAVQRVAAVVAGAVSHRADERL